MTNHQDHYQTDSDQNLVLIAKNTLVWLNQLSHFYGRPIRFLNEIPADELERLSGLGINGLWLVGIWERSPASQKIKQLYGNTNQIASAYSIYSYQIARDLGGKKALDALKKKANRSGIELACDMVPNHTGLDSPWLIDHPDWYISTKRSPNADWLFESPNLLTEKTKQVQIEESYYTQSGAAEVFRYRDLEKGEEKFIYHGNDGTSMPWNDTAQLNYLIPQVRKAVIQQILDISRSFRIIRLDAAMTLVKQHFRRLWFPETGEPKCIPTREHFNIPQADFDRLMPGEFWLEVMDEIKKSSPNTLFLAEAFWLMERFFIIELGIQRVYNSAFMHHLKDEKNAALRQYLLDILDQNPVILERFVNFLTTPDEKPAIEKFGKSAKYFGSCALMASLPGLPLFGHGQIEGFSEHYGMDVAEPILHEKPDKSFMEEHTRLITPLLLQRTRFSSARDLVLFDFVTPTQEVDKNVIVFSNQFRDLKTLVLFNNSPQSAFGKIGRAICRIEKFSHLKNPNCHILEAINLPREGYGELLLKNLQINTTYGIPISQSKEQGLEFQLPPYGFFAFDVSLK